MEGNECFGLDKDDNSVNVHPKGVILDEISPEKDNAVDTEENGGGKNIENQKQMDLLATEKESKMEVDCDDYLNENFVAVKVELVEVECDDSEILATGFMGLDNIPAFPLEVQIAEGEATTLGYDESLARIPIKTEVNEEETGEESKPIDYSCEVPCESLGDIKAEPLEEGYEDRINMILQLASAENHINEAENSNEANESGEEASDGHFLLKTKRRKRRVKGSKNRTLTCAECSAVFKYRSTYDYHVKSQCGTKMIAESNKLVKKEKNQSFTCNECGKSMSSRTSLMVHMRIHNGERPFGCAICHRTFTQKAHLKDHMNIHLSGREPKPEAHTCSECGQMFKDKKSLTFHSRQHFGDKIFDCNVCHKRFRTVSNLKNHKLIHSKKKEFPCTVCGKEFLRKTGLEEHMRVHTQEKLFSCEICLKMFSNKARRDTHLKRHTGELKAVCSVCGRRFACPYDLKIHERKHTGERPFSCNICGRMFSRKVIMETHMTIHTGRKDFVCTQCGEAFNRKSKLDVHLTTHTGETVCCEICHKVFKCKAYLVPHLRAHLGQGRKRIAKRLQCILCRKQFPSQIRLQNHFAQKHPAVFKACPQPSTALVRVESSELAQLSLQNKSCERYERNLGESFLNFH